MLYILWTFVNDFISSFFQNKKTVVIHILHADCIVDEDNSRQFHALEKLQMFLLSYT